MATGEYVNFPFRDADESNAGAIFGNVAVAINVGVPDRRFRVTAFD